MTQLDTCINTCTGSSVAEHYSLTTILKYSFVRDHDSQMHESPQNAAQLFAFKSCSVGFAAFMPLEAVSPDDPPLPKPKLPKPEPKAPDVFAIPAHQIQQCCHYINATSVNGTLSLTTQTHMHRNLAVQSRCVLRSAGCKNRHDRWYIQLSCTSQH